MGVGAYSETTVHMVISLLLLFFGRSRAARMNFLVLLCEEFFQLLSPLQVLGALGPNALLRTLPMGLVYGHTQQEMTTGFVNSSCSTKGIPAASTGIRIHIVSTHRFEKTQCESIRALFGM